MDPRRVVPLLSLLALAFSFAFAGCDDDDGADVVGPGGAPRIFGSWEIDSVTAIGATGADPVRAAEASASEQPERGLAITRWMIFSDDYLYALLDEEDAGFRSTQRGVFQASDAQVDLGFDIFNYTVNGDTLTLSRPDMLISAVEDPDAPSAAEWIVPATVVRRMDAPVDAATDLAWDGNYLWFGNGYSADELHRIDVNTLTVQSTLPTTNSTWGIAWDGSHLWCSSDGSDIVYKVDPTTGSNVHASPAMGAWIDGIAYDGDDLWCASNNERTIYQYNIVSDALVSTIAAGVGLNGMEYLDGFLYVCSAGVVNKCTIQPFQVVEAFAIAGANIRGVAHDGSSFWCVVREDTSISIVQVDF